MNNADSNIAMMAIGNAAERALHRITDVLQGYDLPSAIYRPTLSQDGNKWIALYGVNLQEGVVGLGDSPALAMHDFNRAWYEKIRVEVERRPLSLVEAVGAYHGFSLNYSTNGDSKQKRKLYAAWKREKEKEKTQ